MRSILSLTLMLFAFAQVAAQEPVATDVLPPSGSWARYHVNYTNVLDNQEEAAWTIQVTFLDRIEIDDQPYRWIEFQIDYGQEDPEWSIRIQKFLLPEKEFLADKSPFRSFQKNYDAHLTQTFDLPPKWERSMSLGDPDYERESRVIQGAFCPYLQALSPRRHFSTATDAEKKIAYQTGNVISHQKLTGTVQGLEPELRKRVQESWDCDYELWTSDEVPLGFASGKFRHYRTIYLPELEDPVVVEDAKSEWYLMEFGTGAKSKLPAQN